MTPEEAQPSEYTNNPEQLVEPELKALAELDFFPFLEDQYLSGYITGVKDRYPNADELPAAVENILEFLIDQREDSFVVTSGVSKCAIHLIVTGSMPDHFWDIYFMQRRKARELMEYPNAEIQDYGRSYFHTLIDIDLKAIGKREIPMSWYLDRLAEHLGAEEIHTELLQVVDDGEDIEHREFTSTYKNFKVRVTAGAIVTNLKLDLLKIFFIDPITDEEIFHIDVSRPSKFDKRAVLTTHKQDDMVGELSRNEAGAVTLAIKGQAFERAKNQDSLKNIDEADDPGELLEIVLRNLRQSLLHEKLFSFPVTHEDGKQVMYKKASLDFIYGFLDAESVYKMRSKIAAWLFEGKADLPYKNKRFMRLLQKEFALCATIDPFGTAHALEAGIAHLIPGLRGKRGKTRADWYNIVRSKELIYRSFESTSEVSIDERDSAFVHAQREAYMYGDNGGDRSYDGLEMLMRAIDPRCLGREYEAFLRLWDEPLSKKDITIDKVDEITLRGKYSRVRFGDFAIFGSENAFQTNDDVVRFANGLLETANPIVFKTERIDEEVEVLTAHYNAGKVKQLTVSCDSTNKKREKEVYKNQLRSIALLKHVFEKTFGLTAQEARNIYDQVEVNFEKQKFAETLYMLKTAGVLMKHNVSRISQTAKRVKTSSEYTVIPSSQEQYLLTELLNRGNAFLTAVSAVLVSRGQHTTDGYDIFTLKRTLLLFARRIEKHLGLDSLAGLESLTDHDFDIAGIESDADREELKTKVWLVVEAFRLLNLIRRANGDVVHYIYNFGFFTHGGGKKLRERYSQDLGPMYDTIHYLSS